MRIIGIPTAKGAAKPGLFHRLARPLHGAIVGDSPRSENVPASGFPALWAGPMPVRIWRPFDIRNGQIGLNQRGWPTTQETAFIGHVPNVHVAQGIVPGHTPTFDDTGFIPAVFAGNPLP